MSYSTQDAEYHRQYQARRRRERLSLAIERLGGCCVRCGVTDNLEFDHIIPGTRERCVSEATNWSLKRFLTEVDKCQLLCNSCHREKSKEHDEQGGGAWKRIEKPEHGTELCYTRGCRCEPCKQARYDARVRRGELTGIRGRYEMQVREAETRET